MFKEVGHGEQAIVGFLTDANASEQFLKISRDNSFITQHEASIIHCLSQQPHLRQFFCGANGLTTVQVKPVPRIESTADICDDDDCIPRYALKLEYLPDASNMDDWIGDHAKTAAVDIFPLIKQVLCIIRMAQEAVSFVHYDLHTDNILLRKNLAHKKGTCKVFRFVDGSVKIVPNVAVEPVIIDFGRAYCRDLEDTAVNIELLNTHSGLFSVLPDFTFDPLFFLFKCAGECKSIEIKSLARNLKKYTRHLDGDGWWKSDRTSALDVASSLVRIYCDESKIFGQDLESCLVIMSHLCIIPLKQSTKYKPTQLWPYYFYKFLTQWKFFEKWFYNTTRLQYFLCFFVSVLNVYRQDWFDPKTCAIAQTNITQELDNFMSIECSNVWSSNGLDWFELIRCAYNAGKMLEELLGDVIKNQHDEYCQHTKEATWDNLYATIPTTETLSMFENGGELFDSKTCKVTKITKAEILALMAPHTESIQKK